MTVKGTPREEEALIALTALIAEAGEPGLTPAAMAEKLRVRGFGVTDSEVSMFILSLRTTGEVVQGRGGCWRIFNAIPGMDFPKPSEWDYEFTVHARGQAHPAVRKLFANMSTRQVMTMTAAEFAVFRDDLSARGLELREITRVEHREPEAVL